MSRAVDIAPPQRFRLRPLILSLWTTVLAVALLVICVVGSRALTVPEILHFRGTLVPERESREVLLPADIPLKDTLVSEGEEVLQNQKLAEIDLDRLRPKIETLQFAVLLNATRRDCLLNQEKLEEYDLAAMDLDGQARLEMQTALRECRLLHQEHQLARSQLLQKRDQLRQNAKHLMLQPLPEGPEPAETRALRRAVQLQRFETAARAMELQLGALATRQDQTLVEQVKSLRAEIIQQEALLDRLEPFLKRQWLRAPKPGVIDRLRLGPGPHLFASDVVLMRLNSRHLPRLTTEVSVPATVAKRLQEGDKVYFRLAGLPLSAPLAPGYISAKEGIALDLAAPQKSRLTLLLDPEAVEDSRERRRLISHLAAFDGPSSVEIHLPDTSLLNLLAGASRRFSPAGRPIETVVTTIH